MNLNYTVINGVKIMLEEVCRECGGIGYTEHDCGGHTCHSCKTKGKLQIYYTPAQIEELTGVKWKGDVWKRDIKDQPFDLYSYLDLFPGDTALCAMRNQPAPQADYRVKE